MSLSKVIDLSNSTWGIANWSASEGYGIFGNSESAVKISYYDYDTNETKEYAYRKMAVGYNLGKYESGVTTVTPCENSIIFFSDGSIPFSFSNTAINTFYLSFFNFPREDIEKLIEWMSANGERMSGGIVHKFTKLYDSDTVATSGNKCFKKLTTQPRLTAPTISIEGTTLTITDNEGKATSYDILVDGVVNKNTTKHTFDCLFLYLEEGTYSISVIGKADGYINSKESNVATLEIAKVESEGYTVTITANNMAVSVYDGADPTGTLVGNLAKGKTADFTISSGQMCINSGGSMLYTHSETGGVTFTNWDMSYGTIYTVTGDGTATVEFGWWE